LKKLRITIIFMLIFMFFVAASVYVDILRYAGKPASTEPAKQVIIVESGQKFKSLSEILNKKGVIHHPAKFRLFSRIKGHDKNIKAGEYVLSPTMSPKTILNIFVIGKVRLHRITIPEGYNLRQVAWVVSRAGFGTQADFLKAATNADLVHSKGIDAQTFEGYLFPDTYYFTKDATPEKIISSMVKRFWSVFKPEWKNPAKTHGFTIHQVVTLASIIEKEAGVAVERPIISSVFHNRLKRKIRLQSDPTVIYGIKNFNGNITRRDLAKKTPYNTYKIKGLPPGPIANAGTKAIEAALYPAETRLLYFVSKKDNTHQFSTNIKDHNRAVRKYQLGH
jgi:peptidoglycan lytic transglycosylase G